MLNDKTTKVTFIVSLIVHFSLLTIPQFNLNLSQLKRPEEIVAQIEIERVPFLPKINVTQEKKLKEVKEEFRQIEPLPKLQPEEVVIDGSYKESFGERVETIDSAYVAMLRYLDIVRQKIEEKKEYPLLAREQNIEGVVQLEFTVLSDGQTKEIKVIKSSGYKILDNSAVDTIKKCNPFPPLPEELDKPYIKIELNLVYTLKN